MPRKINKDRGYGETVIKLFFQLLFSNRPHSLTELANMLDCSKPTVSRMIEKIQAVMGIRLERTKRGKEAIWAIKDRKPPAAAYLSQSEMDLLWMCRAFTERLVGKDLFAETQEALFKAQTILDADDAAQPDHFASFFSGTVDYTPHRETIRTLLDAMNAKRVCRVTYKAAERERAKTFHIKPLKLFSYKDTLYLHALRAKDPWQKKWVEPEFDPLLAVHRFKSVVLADRKVPFQVPKNYDFEKAFNRTFGIIKEESFEVEAEFSGWAAVYVEERIWSSDQRITRNGVKVKIKFTASSESEVLSWILSFGDQARILRPNRFVEEVARQVELMKVVYARARS